MLTTLAAAAMLALCGCTGLAALARRPAASADVAASWADTDLPVALVCLVLTNCAPGAEAYEATVLDLAARGFLAADAGPEGLQIRVTDYPGPRPGARKVADYERHVLDATQSRLAGTNAAPFDAVADICRADVRRVWEPFEAGLRADARRRGLCAPRLTMTAKTVALRSAASAGLAGTVFVLIDTATVVGSRHPGIGLGILVAAVSLPVSWGIIGGLARRERLTAEGHALAARWQRERAALALNPSPGVDGSPAGLRATAFAVAARRRTRRPGATQRPRAAWSAFTGTWRPVEIKLLITPGMGGSSG